MDFKTEVGRWVRLTEESTLKTMPYSMAFITLLSELEVAVHSNPDELEEKREAVGEALRINYDQDIREIARLEAMYLVVSLQYMASRGKLKFTGDERGVILCK
jgi:hypothetical protein